MSATDNPTAIQSASPTESPTESCKPPSLADCIAIQGQSEVGGQDQMTRDKLEIVVDVSLFDD
jgi:hypothetical protein